MEFIVGIILYNADIDRLKENIEAVKKIEAEIILIDNNSNNFNDVSLLIKEYNNIEIIHNCKNLGIAKALNQVFEYAEKRNIEYVLTLDQDSIIPENLIIEYEKCLCLHKLGILSPVIIDRNAGMLGEKNESELYTRVKQCITSASMVKVSVWKQCGGFDEKMFIDGVDFEFCHRVTNAGFRIYRVNSVELYHEIGKIKLYNFFGIRIIVKNHNSFRKYFISRNIIYLARKEKKSIIYALLQEAKLILLVVCFEKDKLGKIKAIFKGLRDGFKF